MDINSQYIRYPVVSPYKAIPSTMNKLPYKRSGLSKGGQFLIHVFYYLNAYKIWPNDGLW